MEPPKDFKTLIGEGLDHRSINLERLSQITNIPGRYVEAIQNLDISRLPASPYVRGYIKKIAGVLNLNYSELWQLYEKELNHKTSGAFDKLPTNRFAIQSMGKKGIALSLVVLLVLVYILVNAANLFGTPPLGITRPSGSTFIAADSVIVLEGKFNPKDKLTINEEEKLGDANGNFSVPFNLQPGLNTIEFKVKRFLGKETIITKQVLYQPSEISH